MKFKQAVLRFSCRGRHNVCVPLPREEDQGHTHCCAPDTPIVEYPTSTYRGVPDTPIVVYPTNTSPPAELRPGSNLMWSVSPAFSFKYLEADLDHILPRWWCLKIKIQSSLMMWQDQDPKFPDDGLRSRSRPKFPDDGSRSRSRSKVLWWCLKIKI